MAVTTTNLGVITAYGDAVAAGYTGTKAEWQTLMASYATVGQQAVDAKNDAVAAKDIAVQKATDASTAAGTATQKANEASASAQSIAQSAAQITQNTSDINELKEDLTAKADTVDMLKAFPTDTASGSVASFADGANVPVKSLIVNIDPVQSGNGDPSPTNVRPISGWTGCNVEHAKNVFATLTSIMPDTVYSGVTITNNSDDSVTLTGTCTGNVSIDFYRNSASFPSGLEAEKQYIVSIGSPIDAFEVMAFKGATITPLISFSTEKYALFTIPSDATGLLVRVLAKQGIAYNTTLRVKMCSADGFALYLIDWTTEAGTVYGGKLDVTNGVLTVDRAMVDLGTLNWTMGQANIFNVSVTKANSSNNLISMYTTVASYADMINTDKCFYNGGTTLQAFYIHDNSYQSVSAFQTAVTGQQLVYELATPLTISLTPHEVTALLGSNNIWADTGDSAVEYRADPTLYIQRLTEPDADMAADSNITSGSYFMVGNTLYKATANIASGASITPNVNCTRKSLSEALNEINA